MEEFCTRAFTTMPEKYSKHHVCYQDEFAENMLMGEAQEKIFSTNTKVSK